MAVVGVRSIDVAEKTHDLWPVSSAKKQRKGFHPAFPTVRWHLPTTLMSEFSGLAIFVLTDDRTDLLYPLRMRAG